MKKDTSTVDGNNGGRDNDCTVPPTLVRFFVWTQTNELASEDATALGGALPFALYSKVVHTLQLNITCDGELACDGTGHVIVGIVEAFTDALLRYDPGLAPGSALMVPWPQRFVREPGAYAIVQSVLDHENSITFLDIGMAMLLLPSINKAGNVVRPNNAAIRAAGRGFDSETIKQALEKGIVTHGDTSLSNSADPDA